MCGGWCGICVAGWPGVGCGVVFVTVWVSVARAVGGWPACAGFSCWFGLLVFSVFLLGASGCAVAWVSVSASCLWLWCHVVCSPCLGVFPTGYVVL